jgi:hypothetical protein
MTETVEMDRGGTGIGFFWIAIDPRHQGRHDTIVRTLIVRRR